MYIKFLLIFFICTTVFSQNSDFLEQQLKYSRVRTAKAQKENLIKKIFEDKDIQYPSKNIFIRVFKFEKLLEIWTWHEKNNQYIKLKTYKICALSGNPGPKRRRGDGQIPEGIYKISHFNPVSNFYLSLKINYPNKSDRILGYKNYLGGDIFIHGDCVTIGCVPITDEFIKEVYLIVLQAKVNGQEKIPVHLYPAKLDSARFANLLDKYKYDKELTDFWKNLKSIYDYFNKYKAIPEINIDAKGKYFIVR